VQRQPGKSWQTIRGTDAEYRCAAGQMPRIRRPLEPSARRESAANLAEQLEITSEDR